MPNSVCTQTERIRFYDCDYKNRVKISTILKIVAEIAGYDYTIKGFDHETLWKNQMVFLVSRLSMRIKKHPVQHELLSVSTWEHGKKGALFIRCTDIVDEKGEVLIDATAGWVLANPETRHIYKPSKFNFDMPQNMEKTVSANPIGKIEHGELQFVMDRAVRLTDLDSNGHVYNAFYGDMASDALSQNAFEKDVDNFSINFICEAKMGETISIYSGEQDNKAVVIGKVLEITCFETEFTFCT